MATGERLRRGFSLIELIVVIGLIALVGGLVVINIEAMLGGLGDEPIDRTLRKAVREARYQAASRKDSVQLRFDHDSAQWVIADASGNDLERIATDEAEDANRLRITFEQILPGRGTSVNRNPQTAEIPAAVFRPDRSSTPFQVRIETQAPTFTLRFDPFSDIILHDSRNR